MDPRYTGDILKNLEKQSELLMEAYNLMSRELQHLQVEEEMLMRKCYAIMTAQGVIKKKEGNINVPDADPVSNSAFLLTNHINDSSGGEPGHSTALVPIVSNTEQGD